MSTQIIRNLLIAFAVQISTEHLLLQPRKHLVNLMIDGFQIFLSDDKLLRICSPAFNDHVQQRTVALLVIQRLVEGDVAVQGNMLLTGRCLDGRDDLARNAQLRKCTEGGQLVRAEITDGFVQADHAFLNDILMIRANEEIAPGL